MAGAADRWSLGPDDSVQLSPDVSPPPPRRPVSPLGIRRRQPLRSVIANAGLTFVALSRAKTLSGIAFQPRPPFNRLSRISKCSGLRPRLEHDAELSGLAEDTLRDWEHLLNDPMFSE